MVRTCKATIAVAIATAISIASLILGDPRTPAHAQQTAGSAPFINSWLVSGPFNSAVVDKIYECKAGDLVNHAPRASEITASSSTLTANPVL